MSSVKNGKYSKSQKRCQLAVCKDINERGKDFLFPYILMAAGYAIIDQQKLGILSPELRERKNLK